MSASNPLFLTQGWHNVAVNAVLTFMGITDLKRTLLVEGRSMTSWCTGLGSEDIILKLFVVPALRRHGIYSQLKVVSSCDEALAVDVRVHLAHLI